jgi:DNA polymerase-3 subunit gamma/tau
METDRKVRGNKKVGKALYRKYRSKSLDEIVGQSHITNVLKRAIEQGRVSHAYLLTGPRGVGKTSIARILAHEINKLPYTEDSSHLDIIEIDAASNNGVEDVRDLREKVQITPVSAEKKVYIIDEVHMLSKPAFNALLKTLEEPPEHVVFILATTDADKLPATIVSRTQQFGFRSISLSAIEQHLKWIAEQEKIKINAEALALIARRSGGSFRDSISLLDQLASLSDKKAGITSELVEQTLGLAPHDLVEQLIDAYERKKLGDIVSLLDTAEAQGIQPGILAEQLTATIRTQLAKKPQLVDLLDELLTVAQSTDPGIKLLTVLAKSAGDTLPKPKSAPLAVSTPAKPKEKPIAELEVLATQPKPVEPQAQPKPIVANPKALDSFDWDALLEHTRKNHVAIYSVLVKCGHEAKDGVLTIYTGNAFYKKKLDDVKYRPMIAASLETLGFMDVVIDTVPTTSPLKDEHAAKVAAIMGGGEEVVLDNDGE